MRYKITIEYDGTNLLGWQEQLDGPSVQSYLQQALSCFTPVDDNEQLMASLNTSSTISPLNTSSIIPPLNAKERSGGVYASPELCENEDASTGRHLQKTNAISNNEHPIPPLNVKGRLGGVYASPELYENEDASTGGHPQKTNAFSDNEHPIPPLNAKGRLGGVYTSSELCENEDASTGRRLQKTNKIIVYGAGRTDAGVHALSQVAHFDLKEDLVDWKLREALNARLRDLEAPVSVTNVEKVNDDFHARFSATGRGYLYRILNRRGPAVLEKNRVWWVPVPLDIEKMREGAKFLLGNHDFSSFRAAACQAKSPIKTLDKLDIIAVGEEIHFIVEARSFLHHQVRNMVGTLKMVGDGHLQPEDIKHILEEKKRAAAGVTAPACGLYLTKVVY